MRSLEIITREVAQKSRQLSKEQTEELIVRAQSGDNDARERVVLANMRMVFFHARNLAAGHIEIEDLIQVGGMALDKAIRKWPLNGRFSTYAYRAIKNAMLDYKRDKRRKLNTVRLPEHDGTYNIEESDFRRDEDDPIYYIDDEVYSRLEFERIIARARLTESDLVILRFRLAQNYDREIAEELGLTENQVFRARRILYQKIMEASNGNN